MRSGSCLWEEESVLELDGDMGVVNVLLVNTTELFPLKWLVMLCTSYFNEKKKEETVFTNRMFNAYKYRLGIASFPLLMNPR